MYRSTPMRVITTVQQLDAFIDYCFSERVIQISPDSVQMPSEIRNLYQLWEEGGRLGQQGRFREAISKYKSALSIAPSFQNAWFFLALTLRNCEENQQALEAFKKASLLNPKDFSIYIQIGLIYSELGDKQSEIQAYKKAHEVEPTSWDAANNLGEAYREIGDFETSVSWHMKALKISEGDLKLNSFPRINFHNRANSFNGLGVTYDRWGKKDLAKQAWMNGLNVVREGLQSFRGDEQLLYDQSLLSRNLGQL